MVLDMSRRDVQEFVIETVTRVLTSADISYLKWDMNRPLTDAFSAHLPREQQGEVYHRYVLGLYSVLDEITRRFPNVIIEGCAAGGGRMDPGMLAWMPQCWTSDNTDAFSRLRSGSYTKCALPWTSCMVGLSGERGVDEGEWRVYDNGGGRVVGGRGGSGGGRWWLSRVGYLT